MLRSMYSGISGLRNHQLKMDVIGNNIANVNTIGFKKSSVSFSSILSQTLKNATAPTETRGGTNSQQAGLGMTVGSINVIHSPGSLQSTGRATDLAIEGEGFFILKSGNQSYYSRAGDFSFDRDGFLLNSNGYRVQGYLPVIDELTGNTIIDELNPLTINDLRINAGEGSGARATENIVLINNLDSQVPAGTTVITPVEIFDINGNPYQVEIEFTKDGVRNWDYSISVRDNNGNLIEDIEENTGEIVFTSEGKLDLENSNINALSFVDILDETNNVNLDFTKITQYASSTSVQADFQDGYQSGTLDDVVIDGTGIVTGVYSNGQTKSLGKIAMATFKNPAGLTSIGSNLYKTSNNSGNPDIGSPGSGARGNLSPGTLEMSNVDLSEEFVEMISTQRGFQANSRIITTSDEMLQELTNMKR